MTRILRAGDATVVVDHVTHWVRSPFEVTVHFVGGTVHRFHFGDSRDRDEFCEALLATAEGRKTGSP